MAWQYARTRYVLQQRFTRLQVLKDLFHGLLLRVGNPGHLYRVSRYWPSLVGSKIRSIQGKIERAHQTLKTASCQKSITSPFISKIKLGLSAITTTITVIV